MLKPEINTLLSSFVPIGLNEMDTVSLMNRVETKYVFSCSKLSNLLHQLYQYYKILEIDKLRIFPYHTTYLDTPDFLFYTEQLRGKLNRHKIRYRRYESTGLSFLEIKKKTNKNRTIKWRIESSLNKNSPDENGAAFIKEYLPYNSCDIRPVLVNGFSRITLIENEFKERITLDYNLTFEGPDGRLSELPFIAICELKREQHSGQSPIGNIMKKTGIQPNSFSKYCIGSTLIREMPRINILKHNLLLINKIENEYLNAN